MFRDNQVFPQCISSVSFFSMLRLGKSNNSNNNNNCLVVLQVSEKDRVGWLLLVFFLYYIFCGFEEYFMKNYVFCLLLDKVML